MFRGRREETKATCYKIGSTQNIACVASVSIWFRSKEIPRKGTFGFDRARNETRVKSERGGRRRGRKETLADKLLDFENLRSPANAAPDWLG